MNGRIPTRSSREPKVGPGTIVNDREEQHSPAIDAFSYGDMSSSDSRIKVNVCCTRWRQNLASEGLSTARECYYWSKYSDSEVNPPDSNETGNKDECDKLRLQGTERHLALFHESAKTMNEKIGLQRLLALGQAQGSSKVPTMETDTNGSLAPGARFEYRRWRQT